MGGEEQAGRVPTLYIWGAGRVGRSVALGLRACVDPALAWELVGAWNRTSARAADSARVLGVPVDHGDPPTPALLRADLVLLCASDDAVAEVAAQLGPHLRPYQSFLHTSGSLSREALRQPGVVAHLGACHPLQALASPDGDPDKLRGAVFAVEGDPASLPLARRLALALGGRPVEIASEAKPLYHAAAVLSANSITALTDAACDLLGQAGLDALTGAELLLPLLEGTVQQLRARLTAARASQPPDAAPATLDLAGRAALSAALTGPVRRGDAGTVGRHLAALEALAAHDPEGPALLDLYRRLGQRALLVAQRGDLDPARADLLRALLR